MSDNYEDKYVPPPLTVSNNAEVLFFQAVSV
jgi:hypothetical protein